MKAYLEGTATEEQKKTLEEHVVASSENLHEYLEFKNLWEITHTPFNGGDIDMAKSKRRLFSKAGIRHGARRFLNVWKSAAAALLLPLAGISAYLAYSLFSARPAEGSGGITVSTPYGSIIRTRLADGTSVCLNSGSELSYNPDSFTAGRSVSLEGEAYFDVVADRSNPFTVKLADGTDVTATGTSFNINAYDTGRLRVTLVEGKLDVGCTGHDYRLEHGCQLIRSADGVRVEQADDLFKWISWKDNILAFRSDTMAYVFERLSDIFNVEIDVEDKDIEAMKLRATFSGDKIEDIMSILEQVLPISCEKVGQDAASVERKKFRIFRK